MEEKWGIKSKRTLQDIRERIGEHTYMFDYKQVTPPPHTQLFFANPLYVLSKFFRNK
jgi:hypothetical protein